VEVHHLETAQPLEFADIKVVSAGPVRAAVKARVRYGKSVVDVTVSFCLPAKAVLMLYADGVNRSLWMQLLVRSWCFYTLVLVLNFLLLCCSDTKTGLSIDVRLRCGGRLA
jgi:hypothetical protein